MLVATDTAAVRDILTSPPTDTLTDAVATSALMLAESVAMILAAPPAVTGELPTTPDSMVLLIVFVAPTPVPAPERLKLPLPTLTLSEAATPTALIDPVELASALKAPTAVTEEPASTTPRVVFAIVFSATVTDTARDPELPLPLIAALSDAAATSASIVVASVALSETEPPESTSAERIIARTELLVVLVAPAPAPVMETELPLPEPTEIETPAAMTSASISLVEADTRLTSPVAETSTLSIIASTLLEIVLSATETAMLPLMLLPLLLPKAKLSVAETASARIMPLSVALRLTAPPAVTVLGVPGTESSIAARVVLLTVLVVTATFALKPAALPSLDEAMVKEAPKAVASMDTVFAAVTLTAPPAVTVVSSMMASAELSISLMAIAIPSPTPTLVPLSTLIDAVTAPAKALIVLASSAATVTLPLAVTALGSIIAETSLLIKLPEPDPAPANAKVPSLDRAPAIPRVKASMVELEVALTSTLTPLAVTFFRAAFVVLVMLFSAAAAPIAIAPRLPPFRATASAPAPASARTSLESVAIIVISPLAASIC